MRSSLSSHLPASAEEGRVTGDDEETAGPGATGSAETPRALADREKTFSPVSAPPQ